MIRGLGAVLCMAVFLTGAAAAQMYVPPVPNEMWDTWLFENEGEYHLFFMQCTPELGWKTIGHARSHDLLCWEELPMIDTHGPEGSWDAGPNLTGCTVKHENRYYTFYGCADKGQQIGVMISEDLINWVKYPHNPILSIRPPYDGWAWRDLRAVYDADEKLWHGYVCAQSGPQEPTIAPVTDKTLVAWVLPADESHAAAGVLALRYGPYHNQGEVYDGIVSVGKDASRWTAKGHRRLRAVAGPAAPQQPATESNACVQIAAVYRGRMVTIYRDGTPCARYETDDPDTFGDGSAVLMGIDRMESYMFDKQNPDHYFAGAIEDARIYGEALSAEQLGALRPNTASRPAPIAWWDFEDGTAKDKRGTFPEGKLYGGARIADGKLHLDGKGAFVNTGGEGYSPTRPPNGAVAHLTSRNLLDWEYREPVFVRDKPAGLEPEVPDYFEMGGRHYMLINAGATIYYTMAARRDGPYLPPNGKQDLVQLLARTPGRPAYNYVGRTIPYGDTRLFYHQTMGGRVMWGTPMLIGQNADGTLYLKYWPNLSGLEQGEAFHDAAQVNLSDNTGAGTWRRDRDVITGTAAPEAAESGVLWLPEPVADAMITCEIELQKDSQAGLVWRWDGSAGGGMALDSATDTAAVFGVATKDGRRVRQPIEEYSQAEREDQGPRISKGTHHLRVFVRAHRAELYLNERFVFAVSYPEAAQTGKVGLAVDRGSAAFRSVRVAKVKPMKETITYLTGK